MKWFKNRSQITQPYETYKEPSYYMDPYPSTFVLEIDKYIDLGKDYEWTTRRDWFPTYPTLKTPTIDWEEISPKRQPYPFIPEKQRERVSPPLPYEYEEDQSYITPTDIWKYLRRPLIKRKRRNPKRNKWKGENTVISFFRKKNQIDLQELANEIVTRLLIEEEILENKIPEEKIRGKILTFEELTPEAKDDLFSLIEDLLLSKYKIIIEKVERIE